MSDTPTETTVTTEPRRSRVTTVAAWVGIIAGIVFIVAVPTWLNLVRTFGADLEQGGAQVIG